MVPKNNMANIDDIASVKTRNSPQIDDSSGAHKEQLVAVALQRSTYSNLLILNAHSAL